DADASEGGVGLCGAVVDLGAEGVQRHAALMVTLDAAHLGAAETTCGDNLDALDLRLTHGRLDGLAHCAAEGDTVDQLLSDGLGDQVGVGVDVLDLEDVEGDHLAGELLELAADTVGLSTAAANHDARAGGV